MGTKHFFLTSVFLVLITSIVAQGNMKFASVDIPYKKFVLDNGLTVIIHEDHKAPVVAVNIWYHVGSKNELPGKTGFAHLFEHLMFNGSEHNNTDYFKALDKIGATDLNGTTSNDRTNYFETVPVSAFDQVLWLESDRMGYMVNAINQKTLDEQRGVVQNEKRQYENEPYGLVDEYMTKSVYPKGHPYSWTVIGSMDDLSAASLADVKEWFKTYYGPNNATIAVAGDVKTEEALEKVKKYFGGLPAGPPITKYQGWTAKRTGTQRQYMQDRVNQPRLYKVWNIPGDVTAESKILDLTSMVMSFSKTSRLYKRLVYDEQIATSVYSYADSREIGGLFTIVADVKPGVEVSKVEKAIDEEIALFIKKGPTQEELDRVKTNTYANFIRGLERVGGFGGKSDLLASYQVYYGDPEYYKTWLKQLEDLQCADLQRAAKDWLSDGEYVLEVQPFAEVQNTAKDADRTTMPVLGPDATLVFPAFQRTTLSNGLSVILVQRNNIPDVKMLLSFDAGFSTDITSVSGIAKLAMNMMDEGTKDRNSLQISDELSKIGASVYSYSSLDGSYISFNSLKSNIDAGLNVFADIVKNPTFPQSDFDRLKKEQIVGIQREKVEPTGMALRLLPKYLYGEGHPYSLPLTGSGTEASVNSITREQLIKFHETWIRPNNATLIVGGDISLDELKPKLEKLLGDWEKADVPTKKIATVPALSKSVIYLMDRPGSVQSLFIAGNLIKPYGQYNEPALSITNSIIGGEFTSRINMNIREDKHWSYGAMTFVFDAKGQRPFIVYTSVQTDKTKETLQEIYKELNAYVTSNPATDEEVTRNQKNKLLQIPGSYETTNSVVYAIDQIVTYGLKDDYFAENARKLKSVQTKDIQELALETIKPDQMVWVIVGDRSAVEAPLKEAGYEIRLIDADGNLVK